MRHPTPARSTDGPPTPLAADLGDAARVFFPEARGVEPVAGRGHLARVVAADGAWVVRRWAPETTTARVAFVHAVLATARGAVPRLAPATAVLPVQSDHEETLLTVGNRLYDARSWLPGRVAERSLPGRRGADAAVDLPAVLPEDLCVALAAAVGHLHAATEEMARSPGVPTAPLGAMVAAVQGTWAAQRARLRPIAPKTPPVQRWLAAGERALPAALAALERGGDPNTGTPVALHLGLWPAHVLVGDAAGETGTLVGLLGWNGATVGSPLLDLAHLVSRCRGWSAPAAELVLSAYAAVRPLAPEERRLLPAVAALDLVVAAGRLLDLGYSSRPEGEPVPPTGVRAGAESFLASLENAAAVAAQGDAPRKSLARRWQHRPRPGGPAGRPGPAPSGPAGGPRRPKPDRPKSERPNRSAGG